MVFKIPAFETRRFSRLVRTPAFLARLAFVGRMHTMAGVLRLTRDWMDGGKV